MDEMLVFLAGCLDEDEAAARDIIEGEAGAAEWTESSSGVLVTGPPLHDDTWEGTHPLGDSRLTRFIAQHDPARTLREVARNRRVLDRHQPHSNGGCVTCLTPRDDYPEEWERVPWPCPEAQDLLAVYSDRPGYRPEWVPEHAAG